MPIIMKLNANEYQILSDEMDTLTQMGFAMDDFGTLTVRIDAVPIWLDAAKCVEAVHELSLIHI